MEHIKIITDSASDITKDIAKELDISILPLRVIIDGKTYVDDVDFGRDEYAKMMRTIETIPTTSMVPPDEMKAEFMKNLNDYDHQIYVSLSSKSSGTYNAACMIKNEIEEETGKPSNITIVDSRNLTMLYGIGVIEMAKAVKNGAGYDEALKILDDHLSRITAYFIVDDLKHLQKGGRINPAVAAVGSLLGIKPILTINEGIIDAIGKERGKKKALDKIVSLVINEIKNPEDQIIYVPVVDSKEDSEILYKMIEEKINCKGVEYYEVGSTIVTHAGAGATGILFKK